MRYKVVLSVLIVAVVGVTVWKASSPSSAPRIGATAVVMNSKSVPTEAFDNQVPPPAPDYALDASWAALPTRQDFADRVPAGNPLPDAQTTADVDVFYLQPTTLRSDKVWSQDIADAAVNTWTDVSVTARQAAIFNACCKVYSPRYRQAAFGASNAAADRTKALALAYDDVQRAFTYYIEHYNNGRPFILVGHSQGTALLLSLLEQVVDGSDLRERMVAAYPIGIAIPVGTFGHALKNITICAKPDQNGCAVSWNSFSRKGDASSRNIQAGQRYSERYKTEEGREILCVNPLTFDLDRPDAPKSANLGSLPGDAIDVPLPAVKPGLVGATCREGALYVDLPTDPDFFVTVLTGEVLHMHDMDFFFQNIRANAVLRSQAWIKVHPPH